MKISFFNMYEVLLYIIVILNLEVLNITSNLDNLAQSISVILTFAVFLLYIVQKDKIVPKNFIVYFYLVSIFVYLGFEIIRLHYSSFSGLNISNALSLEKNFFYILLTMPIFELLEKKKNNFLKNIVYIGLIVLVIRSIVWFLFNKFGINIMPGLFEVRGYNWTHGNGYVRLTGTFLDGLIYTFFGIKLFKTESYKERAYYGIIIFFLLFYSFEVYSSRSQLICYLITILCIYIWNSKNKLHTTLNCLFGLILVLIILQLPVAKNFIASFSSNDVTYGEGTMVRLLGKNFYQNEWQNNSILFGFGIAEDGNYLGNTQYFLSDLGISSYIFEFGIVGFVLALLPMLEGLKTGIKSIKTTDGLLLFSLSIYTILSSFMSQNVYDYIRILIIPFILGIILFVQYPQIGRKGMEE
ncbi:hypothetical protein [Limosilactobacillus reuteri]|uniref:hypothetical protein n=1 Tax=Limosilactobacillus reuteri TaxID=1598 RepID=UPI00080C3A68|nr:hypothetical protein [Limosilactobacillus reuteri]ANU51432.1 hypothetical protein A4V07_03785 [Limosilactobacillus reuteri]OXE59090.1 hypothetical protein ADH69_00120 [Limosilactobacillus reuteri]QQR14626.1 hypothetical protein I5Q80_09510 [Limosilactobacillus reuteri]